MSKRSFETRDYMDAVWSYMVEHSDLTPNGAYFVKFHTGGRSEFEKRIWARMNWCYHRLDDRTNETPEQKQERAAMLKEEHRQAKREKKGQFLDRKRMQAAMRKVGRINRRRALIHKLKDASARIIRAIITPSWTSKRQSPLHE